MKFSLPCHSQTSRTRNPRSFTHFHGSNLPRLPLWSQSASRKFQRACFPGRMHSILIGSFQRVNHRSLACYSRTIVKRGFFWTLLVMFVLWIPSHKTLSVKGEGAGCPSACSCGCCKDGGMCPMMANHRRASSGSSQATQKSQSAVSCTCSVSPSSSSSLPSETDLLPGLPGSPPAALGLISVMQHPTRNFVHLSVPDLSLPDPPPRPLSS